jgi:hypothetical protein
VAQNRETLQAFVDSIRPGIAEVRVLVRKDVVWRPDPSTGLPVDSVDANGDTIQFDMEVIQVKIGRCACSFDASDGFDKGPPDLRRPLSRSEIEDKLRTALGVAAVEAGKGKPTEEKAERGRRKSIARARQLLQEANAGKEPIRFRYRKPNAPLADILAVAVQSGHMTPEEAASRLAEGDDPDDVGG